MTLLWLVNMACLPCGHVGGWESRPEQSPTSLVQKFMVPERAMVEERLDGIVLLHKRMQRSDVPPVLGFLALLLQV